MNQVVHNDLGPSTSADIERDIPEGKSDDKPINSVWRHKLQDVSLPEFHGGIVVNFYDEVDDEERSDDFEEDDAEGSQQGDYDENDFYANSDTAQLHAAGIDPSSKTVDVSNPALSLNENKRRRRKRREPSLDSSSSASQRNNWWRVCREYLGPGALVAVGYMDPGNWSTDIAGGSQFGYSLLFVVLLSSLMAMFLQYLSLKAGLATGRDLAQICRDSYPRPVSLFLWVAMEIAIMATDIAEVLGSAVAMKLLFGLPLIAGVCLTACDVIVFLALNGRHFRYLEAGVALLVLLITVAFAVQVGLSRPVAIELLAGFLPSASLATNKKMLFLAVGILGATVMPHNLFLHSSIVLTRTFRRTERSVQAAIHYASIDSTLCLCIAFFVNAAILIVSAAAFHRNGYASVGTLEDAYQLLQPLLHSQAAPILFGLALLAAGQNSTLTGTLTGQIVMEGFTSWTIPAWQRRLLTRLLAIVPAVLATAIGGDNAANDLLLLSQVILGYTLPFAVIPLVHVTASVERMGKACVNSVAVTIVAVGVAALIIAMNIILLSLS